MKIHSGLCAFRHVFYKACFRHLVLTAARRTTAVAGAGFNNPVRRRIEEARSLLWLSST